MLTLCPEAGDTRNRLLFKIAASFCKKSLRVSFEGDSIVKQPLPTWPDFLVPYFPAANETHITNFGLSGDHILVMAGEYAAEAHLNRPTYPGEDAWFFLHGGGNDIRDGTSVSNVYIYLKILWSLARNDGYKVVAINVLPRAIFEANVIHAAQVVELNQLIASDPTLYDFLVPADTLFNGHTDDTNLLYDGTHPTIYGAGLIAQMVANVIGI